MSPPSRIRCRGARAGRLPANLIIMSTTPKTGSVHTYSPDSSKPADPALAGLAPNTEVTVDSADRDSVRVSWTDPSGAPRAASVKADQFSGSFSKKG